MVETSDSSEPLRIVDRPHLVKTEITGYEILEITNAFLPSTLSVCRNGPQIEPKK